ncbi:MAG: GerW family sporulation protein [Mycobacteriales bacterium]
MTESQERAAGPATQLLRHLAERLGATATASTVYGEPVRNGDVTVIPVARVRLALGAGGGSAEGDTPGEGGGGGGAASAVPIGYLELANGTTRFRRIRHPLADLAVPAALLLAVTARIVRAARKRRR